LLKWILTHARERRKKIQSFRAEIVVVTLCITHFCVEQLCILPTEFMYVFLVFLTVNSDYFPKQD